MARTGNGSTNFIKAAAIAAPSRYTIHCFYRNTSVPNSASDSMPYAVATGDFFHFVGMWWNNGGNPGSVIHRRADGSYDILAYPGAFLANTWYGVGMSYDGTNLKALLNGVSVASMASGDPPTSTPQPSCLAAAAPLNYFDAGTIAEFCIYDVALTTGEILALGKGVCPILVRPQSLICYLPLIRDIVYRRGAPDSVVGTTVAAHPRMYYGRGRLADKFPDGATVNSGTITNALVIANTFTPASGPLPALSGSWSDALVLSSGERSGDAAESIGSSAHFVDGYSIAALAMAIINPTVSFTSTFAPNSNQVVSLQTILDRLRFRSIFTSSTGDLANDRFRGYY